MKAEWDKDSAESMAYKDLYTFHKAYGIPEKADDYWAALIDAAGKINERYKDTKMANIVARHLIGVMTLLDGEAQHGSN